MKELITLSVLNGHDGTFKGKVTVSVILPDHTEKKLYAFFCPQLRANREEAIADAKELEQDWLSESVFDPQEFKDKGGVIL